MLREIGSEFSFATHRSGIASLGLPFDLSMYSDYTLVRSGRDAIGLILDHIGAKAGVAILPSYVCTSMVRPFLQRGCEVRYFGVDRGFNPQLDQVKLALSDSPDVALIIDWFGLKRNDALIEMIRELAPDTRIIEDRTHNLFDTTHSLVADFVVASIRKWFALPDGGLAASRVVPFSPLANLDSEFGALRRTAMALKDVYLSSGDPTTKSEYRRLFAQAEALLDNTLSVYPMSDSSCSLLGTLDHKWMARRRMENFMYLRQALGSCPVEVVVRGGLSDNQCPLFFPILVRQCRDELQKWLAQRGVYCPVLWPLPSPAYHGFPDAAYLSDNILCIPCDHRYSASDMEHVSELITSYFEETHHE